MNRILCIWLPNWPIQRLVVARSELKGRMVVLHAPDARRGQRVVAYGTHPELQTEGEFRAGMSLAEAAAVATNASPTSPPNPSPTRPTTPTNPVPTNPVPTNPVPTNPVPTNPVPTNPVHWELHDPRADLRALEELAEWCQQFSPFVGWEKESLLLDVTGLGSLFGGERSLAYQVVTAFQRLGYLVRVAIAETIGAAWAVARFGMCSREADPSGMLPVAHLPCLSSPGGDFRILAPGENFQALQPLPVEALRLPEETVETLHQLGIVRIEQLVGLPRASLSSRFGHRLLERLDQAAGTIPELILLHRPSPQFRVQWSLESPSSRRDVIDTIFERLVQQLGDLLAQHDLGAIRLECRLDCDFSLDDAPVEQQALLRRNGSSPAQLLITAGLFHPTACAAHLLELIRLQLEQLRLPGSVKWVELHVPLVAPLDQSQGQLFADSTRRPNRWLALLIDRLSSRLGDCSVTRPCRCPDVQPERAFRDIPLTSSSWPAAKSRPAAQKAGRTRASRSPAPRPLQLLDPPLPLVLISVVPDGPPVQFSYRGRKEQITRSWGPERIETGWWRGPSIRRDYYRVETGSGSRFWLFRRLDDGKWFLQGIFQ